METQEIKKDVRSITVERSNINTDNRTITISASSEEPYLRSYGWEIVSHDSADLDINWLKSGNAPVLMEHNWEVQIGVIKNAWIENKRLMAEIQFSRSEYGEEVYQDVLDGIRNNISIGYEVLGMERINDINGTPAYKIKARIYEISSVSVPADQTVGTNRAAEEFDELEVPANDVEIESEQEVLVEDSTPLNITQEDEEKSLEKSYNLYNKETRIMEDVKIEQISAENILKTERSRVGDISALASKFGINADSFIKEGRSVEDFRSHVLDQIADTRKVTTVSNEIGLTEKESRNFSFAKAINAAATGDWSQAGFELACSRTVASQRGEVLGSNSFFVPAEALESRASVSGTHVGSDLVGTTHLASSFIEMLYNRTVIDRTGATRLSGLVGNISIPKLTGGATTYWVDEDAAVTASDIATGSVTLTPKTVGALVPATRKLLMQSSPNVESIIRNDIIRQLAVAIDKAIINGTGQNGQPLGILGTQGIGAGPSLGTTGGVITWAAVTALYKELAKANADEGTLTYITNPLVVDQMLHTLRTPGATDGFNILNDANEGRLNGFNLVVSNNVPSNLTKSTGTGLSALVLGNFADLIVGSWSTLQIDVSPYSNFAKGGIEIRALTDLDVAVRHAESFAALKDIAA